MHVNQDGTVTANAVWNDIADKALAKSVTVIEELPSHTFTHDVVEWAEVDRWDDGPDVTISATFARKLSRQILAAVGRG